MQSHCAACKYLRRRSPSNCIFSPYFPPNDPQRFACVHRIYGASNVARMLQQLPGSQQASAVDCLYYEAQCRIQDPVYGCAGIISLLYQQIHSAELSLQRHKQRLLCSLILTHGGNKFILEMILKLNQILTFYKKYS